VKHPIYPTRKVHHDSCWKLTLLKQANTLGTLSLGPSIPGIKSMRGPIQLNGLTIVNSRSFSAPSAAKTKKGFQSNSRDVICQR